MAAGPGRNDPCPCGSGRKFKLCCLAARTSEDAARIRVRTAEGHVVDRLLKYVIEQWGQTLLTHAWEDFWNYSDVPGDLPSTPEFDPMFVPWLVLGFVADPEGADAEPEWPTEPIGVEWLATTAERVADLERRYIHTACRSPMSVVVVEQVIPGRSLDLRDVLTGARFHVLEQSASQRLRIADLLFTRIVTIEGVSVMFGAAPYIVPPRWHTHILDWREQGFGRRLMTRRDLEDFDIEIRGLYFGIAAELLEPTPPQLANTDGDPLALTTLTYALQVTANEAFQALLPLTTVGGEEHVDEVTRNSNGAVTAATLSWLKAGNRKHKQWDNTILGTLRLDASRLIAEVNSERRATRLKRELNKRLGQSATLIDSTVLDPSEAVATRVRQRQAGELADEPTLQTPPELQEIQEEMLRQHWAQWLDTRVPALRNKTPRQAARTAAGREQLEALLAGFERDATNGPSRLAAHIASIRNALSLTQPRGAPDQ